MEYKCPECLKNSRLVCLDLETTGLSPIFNNIIELGVVEVLNGEIKTKYSRLFGGGRSSIYLVRKIHKIKDSEREGKTTFAESAASVANWLNGSILLTHNGAKFDIPFMKSKMEEVGVKLNCQNSIDTFLISKKYGEHEFHSLQYLCKKYEIPYGEENHRGLTDCICTVQLLYAFIEKFGPEVIGMQ